MAEKVVTVKDVMAFFEIEKSSTFAPEWRKLTDEDKEQIKRGIGDGSLTY